MKHLYWILLTLLFTSCFEVNQKQRARVDSLNYAAYNIRYTDVDSTRCLAQKAYQEAEDYSDGKARALNLLAYVDYQQMDFATAFLRLDSVALTTSNQIILLVSDVMRMKINQRTGDGSAYFEARISAQKRMKRAEEEFEQLTAVDRHDYFFARTEYHIISSTYCYYQDQDQQAIEEMAQIAGDFTLVTDTTQWLYYNYMMGSGGLVEGTPLEIALKEFDYLMVCWGFSRSMGITYFEANSLQALASLLTDEETRQLIRTEKADLYHLLLNQHEGWLPQDSLEGESHLPEALALHAVYSFRQYRDLFQTACAYRTLGEMAFNHGHYELALENYSMALDCVNEQYVYNNHDYTDRLLSLYEEGEDGNAEVELDWINSDSIYTVPEWIAGIRQKISMAFSALGMTKESDYNRNIYLDIIARTSQNVEMESRRAQLQSEVDALHLRFLITALLFVVLVVLILLYSHHLRKSNDSRLKTADLRTDLQKDAEHLQALEEQTEEIEEQVGLTALKIDNNKRRNAEKRAKVSLVHAVTPFLDRIIHQTDRMNREGEVDGEKLEYITELTERIVTYNDILTDWIKMEKGELSLQIGTIALDKIFQTLQRGHYAFDQKGVTLEVLPTDLSVKADEALTLFMLNTLADNARKFTPEGGKVTIQAVGHDDYVELSVSDTGCGMSADDVDTLNNSKVYDSRKIGSSQGNKGFGFGIMNCRGIIEKYRKTSSIFQMCCFGVESEQGKGSRFFFRLPRVLSVIICMLCMWPAYAQDLTAEQYCEQAYQSNQAEQYEQTIQYALQGLQAISPKLTLSREQELDDPRLANEVDLFLQGDSLNYQTAIRLRNEIARASLALHEWEWYKYNNTLCTSLYKLYHQDRSLPTYCEKLQQTQSASRQLLMALIIFSLLVMAVALMFLRRRMYLGKGLMMQRQLCQQLDHLDEEVEAHDMQDLQNICQHLLHATMEGMSNWQHLTGMSLRLQLVEENQPTEIQEGVCEGNAHTYDLGEELGQLHVFGLQGSGNESLDRPVASTLSRVLRERVLKLARAMARQEQCQEELNHLRFEAHRLHVQNQVLDNCLSTIKHESMYYPSRILQLTQRMSEQPSTDDLSQLVELSAYYKEVYTLLSGQAEKLTLQNCYRKEVLDATAVMDKAKMHFNKLAKKRHLPIWLEIQTEQSYPLRADAVLMEDLLVQFNTTFVSWYESAPAACSEQSPIVLTLQEEGNMLRMTYRLPGIVMDETKAHTLFYPESGHIHLLVAKQIVRELDALNNFPGLRLVAQPGSGYTDIWFTLR